MLDNLKDWYEELSKLDRLKVNWIFLVVLVLLVVYLAYDPSEDKKSVKNTTSSITTVPLTSEELFEDDVLDAVNLKNEKTEKRLDLLAAQNENLKKMLELKILSKGAPNQESGVIKSFPASPSNNHDTQKDELQFEPTWVGGIVHTEYEKIEDKEEEVKDLEKKRTIKLPPSFMEGFLLTGMDAMTIEGSSNTPEPMMIRVQAPAVLPNEVKANLKGCFVIAEGYGNLATHRVDARLKSLSCIDLEGGSVIYEKIKGYVQDADGKRGIKGQIVHRAGALLARSMIAGAFEGIGEAVKVSSQTTSISALGETNSTPSGNLSKAALGGGISAGAKDVRSLFLQLARQSSPVVEIGAAKKISVIITELVILKIQEF